jgi:type I restriction enzyme S subunit
LPPVAEQTRIVAKLEELLSDLDAGVAELKAAQKKLVQYRQSLLKAAVEGALTAEWREKQKAVHPDSEPVESIEGLSSAHGSTSSPRTDESETGAQLLQRILAERRARWEAKQLAKFKEQGKTPPKDWQKKYSEPVQPDTTDLPALPQGWVWASLDELIEDGPQNGLYLPASQYGRGTHILRIDDYQIGWHRVRTDLNLVDADEKTTEIYALNVADLVINRVNSMTHLGKSLCIGEELSGVLFESNMMRLHLTGSVDADYVAFYLGSDLGRERLTNDAKWAVNQASINQQDVRKTPIPVPPQAEQKQIAELFSNQHDAMERQTAAIGVALKQSTAQRQNILRAAFAGQLVPQDPSDEPASVLLERIRAERAAKSAVKKPRGRKTKESTYA